MLSEKKKNQNQNQTKQSHTNVPGWITQTLTNS